MGRKAVLSTGVEALDHALGGVRPPENVLWLDHTENAYLDFSARFARRHIQTRKPFLYLTFHRIPGDLLQWVQRASDRSHLLILNGSPGTSEDSRASPGPKDDLLFRRDRFVKRLTDFSDPEATVRRILEFLPKRKRTFGCVVDNLTRLTALWTEERTLLFVDRMVEGLNRYNVLTYWICNERVHSRKFIRSLEARMDVVVDLSSQKDRSTLTIRKAAGREDLVDLNTPIRYRVEGNEIRLETHRRLYLQSELGRRLRKFRIRRGISQTDLARMIGVTPSSISQIESSLIYPSIPALLRMADILDVDVSAFFSEPLTKFRKPVMPKSKARKIPLPEGLSDAVRVLAMGPENLRTKGAPYVVEISPGGVAASHFFDPGMEQLGYVIQGRVLFQTETGTNLAETGDVIYLSGAKPTEWRNMGEEPVRLFWVILR